MSFPIELSKEQAERAGRALDRLKLTPKQQMVLDELRVIGRLKAFSQLGHCQYLFQSDCEKLTKGDAHCVFGMGSLTWQVGTRLGLSAGSVLSTFKALEAKGLVIRETRNPWYQRPLYWWPVGLANELCTELADWTPAP